MICSFESVGTRSEGGVLPLPVWGEGGGEGVTGPSQQRNPSPHPSPYGRGSRPSQPRECVRLAHITRQFFATTSFTAPTQPVWVRSNTMPSGSLYFAS